MNCVLALIYVYCTGGLVNCVLALIYVYCTGGLVNCALALGFEKMQKGSLSSVYSDRANPVQPHVEAMMAVRLIYFLKGTVPPLI